MTNTPLWQHVVQTINAHPDLTEKVRQGRVAAASSLVAEIMQSTQGAYDALTVRELLLSRINHNPY